MSDFTLIDQAAGVRRVVDKAERSGEAWIDFETVGLNPFGPGAEKHRPRLLQLNLAGEVFVLDLDKTGYPALAPLLAVLPEKLVGAHNLKFELQWLRFLARRIGYSADYALGSGVCTYVLAKLVSAGLDYSCKLDACVERELGGMLSKELQTSDWSGELSAEQLAYAARDVAVLPPLFEHYWQKIKEGQLERVARVELRCVPAVSWMEESGVPWDAERWDGLLNRTIAERAEKVAALNSLAPLCPRELERLRRKQQAPTLFDSVCLDAGEEELLADQPLTWNWDSPKQTLEALVLADVRIRVKDEAASRHGTSVYRRELIESTGEELLALADHPLAEALREYRATTQRIKMFGDSWLPFYAGGRLWPSWRQMGAETGRLSASEPNVTFVVQKKDPFPPAEGYRSTFRVAEGSGRCLVIADYSQIELRTMARISGDGAMRQAYMAGRDIHTETARNVLKVSGEVTKGQRDRAKIVNFGLIYGLGVPGLISYAKSQFGIRLEESEAQQMHDGFFGYYRGIKGYHEQAKAEKWRETRTLLGRRRYIPADGWVDLPDGGRKFVSYFSTRVNSPTQGSGGDAIKAALAALWETRQLCPSGFPVIACHDELVVEVDRLEAEAAASWVQEAMRSAWGRLLDPVPVGPIEPKIAGSWAEKG